MTGEGVRLEFGPNLGWIGMNEFKITLVEIYNSGKSMKCWGINWILCAGTQLEINIKDLSLTKRNMKTRNLFIIK